jgi:putative hydrolase of the HAD superfamily
LDGIKQPYEKGDLDDVEFVARAVEALEFRGSKEEFVQIWCEIFEENHAMKASLAGCTSSSERLFLLSNTSGLHKDYLFEQYSIFQFFRGGVYSYSAKCAKPDRQIFEMAIKQFDLHPEVTLYVDDLEANLVTARALGFQTHLYRLNDHSAFESTLEKWKASVGMPF